MILECQINRTKTYGWIELVLGLGLHTRQRLFYVRMGHDSPKMRYFYPQLNAKLYTLYFYK